MIFETFIIGFIITPRVFIWFLRTWNNYNYNSFICLTFDISWKDNGIRN